MDDTQPDYVHVINSGEELKRDRECRGGGAQVLFARSVGDRGDKSMRQCLFHDSTPREGGIAKGIRTRETSTMYVQLAGVEGHVI